MASFPGSIFSPRAVADRAGVVYDADKTKVFYAKDHNDFGNEIVAIQTALGTNPVGSDGWKPAGESWAYASPTTITVPAGATAKYQKGDKIKFTQPTDGVKYMYIIAVAGTLLTVTGGSDYDLDNEAITSPHYSKLENPQGFPQWFNYTPTGPTNTTLTGRFSIVGKTCEVVISGALTGASSFTNMPTIPVAASADLNSSVCPKGVGFYYDDGVGRYYFGIAPVVEASATVVRLYDTSGISTALSSSNPITWSNGDSWSVQFRYEI